VEREREKLWVASSGKRIDMGSMSWLAGAARSADVVVWYPRPSRCKDVHERHTRYLFSVLVI
jgi:hypothetical protein